MAVSKRPVRSGDDPPPRLAPPAKRPWLLVLSAAMLAGWLGFLAAIVFLGL